MRGGEGVLDAFAMWTTVGPGSEVLVVLLRATVLLAGALAAGWWLGRGTARARHLLWTTTFLLLLGLPAAAVWLPALELPVLPSLVAGVPGPAPTVPGASTGSESVRGSPTAVPPVGSTGDGRGVVPHEGTVRTAPHALASKAGPGAQETDLGQWAMVQPKVGIVVLGLWALGVLGGLCSLALGTFRFRALVGRTRPVQEASIMAQAQAIQERLGIRRPVRLRLASEATTPMAGGVVRPVVVLPPAALEWQDRKLEVVLTHELVHVLRHDTLRHMIGCLALTVYWFHPLSWVASRMAMNSREQACDEEVVALGTRPSEYARHLLDLVEGLKPVPWALSLPMVQPSQLEKRVMSILASNQKARNSLVTGLTLVLFCAFGVTAAVAIPVALQSPEVPPAPALADLASLPAPALLPTPEAPSMPAAPPLTRARAFQEGPSCRMEGLSGSFSGTMSTRGGRTEHAGWHNGDRAIQKYVEGLRLCYRVRGEVVMEDDGTGVRAAGADSWVVLEAEGEELQRLVIVEGPSGLEYAWSVDGVTQPFDAAAQEWHDRMFSVLGAYWEAARIRGEESRLKGQISSMKGHVSSLKGQISSHRGHVSSLKGQISSHRGRVSSMKGQISSARGRVSSMRGQISSIRGQMSSLRSAARITEDTGTRLGLQEELDEHEARIAEIQEQIAAFDVESRVQGIQGQVEQYGLEARVEGIEGQIDSYDLESRVQEIQQEIDDYGLDRRIEEKEREIEALGAARRAADVEARAAPELQALLRLIRGGA